MRMGSPWCKIKRVNGSPSITRNNKGQNVASNVSRPFAPLTDARTGALRLQPCHISVAGNDGLAEWQPPDLDRSSGCDRVRLLGTLLLYPCAIDVQPAGPIVGAGLSGFLMASDLATGSECSIHLVCHWTPLRFVDQSALASTPSGSADQQRSARMPCAGIAGCLSIDIHL